MWKSCTGTGVLSLSTARSCQGHHQPEHMQAFVEGEDSAQQDHLVWGTGDHGVLKVTWTTQGYLDLLVWLGVGRLLVELSVRSTSCWSATAPGHFTHPGQYISGNS